ncbi:SH3 domain-containing protein [Clostridium sp.]|jgi:cell wall-associated NlpC family hydrolase|uniref:C40 family peptidase n=1 Tax=Clostridium sp. TaxID=1506 RepID=UPI003EE93191
MKKRIAFLVMLITIASSQIASAAESGVVTGSGLRVRQTSSLSSTIEGHLSKNTKIEILGKEGRFYKIAYKGKTGYVHSSYINVVKSITSSGGADNVQALLLEKQGEITVDYLNVRSGAGVSYAVNGVITRGSKVTVYEKINGFYKIKYKGETSYISASYVKVVEGKTVIASNVNSTRTVISRGAVSAPETKSTGTGTVTASDFLNVRKTASISDKILGEIYPNSKVEIYGTQGSFYKIKYASGWGYIYKSYVSVANNVKQKDIELTGDKILDYASKFMGIPYLWGGTTPVGFDCSGFVQYVYKNFSIDLPRVTMDQVNVGKAVNIENLQTGDLIYFRTNTVQPSQVSHVGIYTGDNKFIQAPKTGDIIRISELTGYYKDNFVIGRRMLK